MPDLKALAKLALLLLFLGVSVGVVVIGTPRDGLYLDPGQPEANP